MTQDRRKIRILFRILDLSEAKIGQLQKSVKGAKFGFRSYHLRREPSVRGAEFLLKEGRSYNDLVRFLKANKIRKSSYGIWISLITSNDTGGVHVPAFVVKLYEETGGNIDFTFTSG